MSYQPPVVVYPSASGSGPFSVPFTYRQRDDVKAYRGDGSEVILSWASVNTVNLVGVTLASEQLVIERTTNYEAAAVTFRPGAFSASDMNAETAQLLYCIQELIARLGRTVSVPRGEQGLELDPVALRASSILGFGSNGEFVYLNPELTVSVSSLEFATRTQAALTVIPGAASYLRTAGYSTVGDHGGALYTKAVSEPAHAGKFQSADGAWWELNRLIVTPEMLGCRGDGVTNDWTGWVNALALLSDGGVLECNPRANYRLLNGNGNDNLPDNILADHVLIEGNGCRITGLPADGAAAGDPYNQHYFIFKASDRTGIQIRNLRTRGTLALANFYRCGGTVFEGILDNGKQTGPGGYLRDKTIFLYACGDTSITDCTFYDHNFAVYLTGTNALRCKRTTVQGCHFAQVSAAGAFTAPFPVGVYPHYADDTVVNGNTFEDMYSSVDNGDTGTGLGYGVYEGDGAANAITVTSNTFTFSGKGNKWGAGVYINEAETCNIANNVVTVASAGKCLYGILVDSKNGIWTRNISANSLLNRSTSNAGTAIAFQGSEAGNPEGHSLIAANDVEGWGNAVTVFNLGRKSKHRIAGNRFRGQLGAHVSILGTATNPIAFAQIVDNMMSEGKVQGIHLAGWTIGTAVHRNEVLDGNLSGAAGDLASALLMSTNSFGLSADHNVVGNTPLGGGQFDWGFTNSNNPSDRIFKDTIGNDNVFLGIAERGGLNFRRFLSAAPTASIFDLQAGDRARNNSVAAGGATGWRNPAAPLRTMVTASASSASTTVTVASTAGMAPGQYVLITRTVNPYYGGYASDWHYDLIASVTDGTHFVLTAGIPAPLGTFASGVARVTVAPAFKAEASIAA